MGFDPEHYRIVKEASDKSARISLNDAQLMGADLDGLCLEQANLKGADLSNAKINNSNLLRANLVGANMELANCVGTTLIRANLMDTNLRRADFSEANLLGSNLDRANIEESNLQQADLSHASMIGAKIRFAHLVLARLFDSDLRHTDFAGSNLDEADFSRAILFSAKLTGVSVLRTNFDQSRFGHTILDRTNISEAIALESVKHDSASTVGFDSLVRSKGKLPRNFLQGCGLADSFIDYLPSLIDSINPIDYYSCFISYSHKDKPFANRLHNDLQAKGIRCWLDDHDLKYGEDIYAGVDQGIRLWDKVILCASENSLKSGWVEREVDTAIEMELKHKKDTGESVLKIIPINLDGSLFDWTGKHAADLRRRLAGDFVDWGKDNEKYETNFERLVKALNPEQPEPPAPKLFKD